jgi:hypothetical protein
MRRDISISAAPAPATNLASLVMALTTLIPSSKLNQTESRFRVLMARSRSFREFSVLERRTMVDTEEKFLSRLTTTLLKSEQDHLATPTFSLARFL